MNIFDPNYVQQTQADAANRQAALAYQQAVASFQDQVATYQQRAQDEWDKNHVVIPPPAVPMLKQFDVVNGLVTEVAPINQLGLKAPVFVPVVGKGGSSISAQSGPSNSDLLAVIYQQNIALNTKLDTVLKAVTK